MFSSTTHSHLFTSISTASPNSKTTQTSHPHSDLHAISTMLYPSLSAILLASALSVEAVDVFNYQSNNCGSNKMGGCTGLPQSQCCRFTDSFTTIEGLRITSGTNSVKWINLQECEVGSWFYPRPGVGVCGSVRASAAGPSRWTCLSANGQTHRRDGAMW
jgi:hypothetical protein